MDKVQKICEEVKKLKKLADAMYCAAQYLTTDASRLYKAMDEYHQFIINECHKEEPVSDDLEECTREIILESANFNKSWYAHPELAFKAGAKWQKKQDKSIIELAEDHAMFAGMEKMKEKMMEKNIKE